MSSKNWIILIIVAALFLGFWWKRHHRAKPPPVIEETVEETDVPEIPRQQVQAAAPDAPAPPGAPAPVAAPVPQIGVSTERQSQMFTQALRDVGTCLGLKTAVSEGSEPTLDMWMSGVRGETGEPVIQTEDWSSTRIDMANGEKRAIKIEMDYGADERVVRRLKYYKLDATGAPGEAIPLSREQTEDPTDTFIASLEGDGQVSGSEKLQRIYFQNGEEIIVTEKNGRVSEIEMNRNGKSFRCQKMDAAEGFCRCI